MNLKILYLFPLLGLAACDNSDNPAPSGAALPVEVSSAATFEASPPAAPPETAQAVAPATTIVVAPEATKAGAPEPTAEVTPETTGRGVPHATTTRAPETTVAVIPEATKVVAPETAVVAVPEATTTVAVVPETTVAVAPETIGRSVPQATTTRASETTKAVVAESTVAVIPEPTKVEAPEPTKAIAPETTVAVAPEAPGRGVPQTTTTAAPETTKAVIPETTKVVAPETTKAVVPETTVAVVPEAPGRGVPQTTTTAAPETTKAVIPEPTKVVAPEPTKAIAPEPTKAVAPETTVAVVPEAPGRGVPQTTPTAAPETKAVIPEPTKVVAPEPTKAIAPETLGRGAPEATGRGALEATRAGVPSATRAGAPEVSKAVTPETTVAVAPESTGRGATESTGRGAPTPPAATVDPGAVARLKAAELMAAGKPYEAVDALKQVGLDEEAYALVAPADYAFNQKDHPASDATPVDETPSSMRHSMTINGKTVWFTAKAGHYIAYAPRDSKNPDKKDAKAAIFYMAYTRDDLPPENRPVTFFFNGGPGYSSVFLHNASWGPQRLKIDTPNIPKLEKDLKFPLIETSDTLLDQTDIVFVDPVGTGYSKAIAPHKNEEFYFSDTDAAIVRDFVARYVSKNSRQSSPKYLYGESFGGSRVAYAGALIENAGTSLYEPDPSGKPTKVLTGIVFQSPLLIGNGCPQFNFGYCILNLPTKAFTADYLLGPAKSWRGKLTLDDYADYLRGFFKDRFAPTYFKYNDKIQVSGGGGKSGLPAAYTFKDPDTPAKAEETLKELRNIFGDPSLTADQAFSNYGDIPLNVSGYGGGQYDTRLKADYKVDLFEEKIFGEHLSSRLPAYLNYFPEGEYATFCGCTFDPRPDWGGVVEIAQALKLDPKLKMLVVHGYYDMSTPFFSTESSLKQAGLDKSVPVKVFEGGHMTYYTEAARGPMKKALDEFYMAQPTTTVAAKN